MYTAFIPFPRPSFNHMHTHAFKSREPWTLRFPVARTSRPCSLLQRSPFPVARASRPCPSLHRSVFFRHPCERSSIKTSTARAAHPLMGNTHAHRQQVRRPCCTVCSTLASALHARHPRSTDVPPVFLTSASRVRCSPFPVARASRPCPSPQRSVFFRQRVANFAVANNSQSYQVKIAPHQSTYMRHPSFANKMFIFKKSDQNIIYV